MYNINEFENKNKFVESLTELKALEMSELYTSNIERFIEKCKQHTIEAIEDILKSILEEENNPYIKKQMAIMMTNQTQRIKQLKKELQDVYS